MSNQVNETLSWIAEVIFEELAFVLPAFDEDDEASGSEDERITGRIAFAGPFDGTLVLSLPVALLTEVSTNMLGLDFGEEPSTEHNQDAFRELLNVICGNLLPKIGGEQAVFKIGVGEIVADPQAATPGDEQTQIAATRLQLEGGAAELSLFVNEQGLRLGKAA